MSFNELTPDDVPNELRFSPSRIRTHETCSYKHHNMYRLGYRAPWSASYLDLGTIIHRFLALHYEHGMTPTEALPIVKKEFQTYQEQVQIYPAMALVTRYLPHWKERDRNIKVLGVEKELIVPYITPNGVQVFLHGILDLVYETAQGDLEIMDHKSSARKVWNVDSVWFDPQVAFYMVLLMQLGFDPRKGIINQVSTSTTDSSKLNKVSSDKLFSRFQINPSSVLLENWRRSFGEKIDKILEESTHPKTQSNQCAKSCPFFEACLMEMRGKDRDAQVWLKKTYREPEKYTLEIDLE